jgi:hypothetical protein
MATKGYGRLFLDTSSKKNSLRLVPYLPLQDQYYKEGALVKKINLSFFLTQRARACAASVAVFFGTKGGKHM